MQNELFEKTSVSKAYLKLSLPVVFSSVLTLVYNLVDTYFIGQTNNASLVAGVSLCGPIFTLLVAMGDIFGLGGSSVISRLLGEKNEKKAKRMSVFCLDGGIIFGLCFGIILFLLKTPVLNLLGAESDTFEHAASYYTWIALGSPFIILSLVPTNLLRTEGHAVQAMIGSIIGSIVNIILDPVFIFTFGMGAGGAAIATVIGNICADIFYITFIIRRSGILAFHVPQFRITAKEIGQILAIGIPGSITNLVSSIGTILLNNALLPYGTEKIAAYGIVSKVTMIIIMLLVGFAFGGQPLYGYLYGAKMHGRMKKVIRFAFTLEVVLAACLSLILYIAAPFMMTLFIKDAGVIETGVPMMRALLLGMPFMAIVLVTTCLFQSCGKAWQALILSAGRQGVFFAIILVILSHIIGYQGVIHAQPVSDVCTSAVAILLLRKTLLPELKESA